MSIFDNSLYNHLQNQYIIKNDSIINIYIKLYTSFYDTNKYNLLNEMIYIIKNEIIFLI
jgi:hypothetical protein